MSSAGSTPEPSLQPYKQSSLTERLSLFPGCEVPEIYDLDFPNNKMLAERDGPHL